MLSKKPKRCPVCQSTRFKYCELLKGFGCQKCHYIHRKTLSPSLPVETRNKMSEVGTDNGGKMVE